MSALDPVTGQSEPLFNPREHNWSDHFVWTSDGLRVVGRTPTGRATVNSLRFNRERVIPIRAADIAVGRHPPEDDPVEGAADK